GLPGDPPDPASVPDGCAFHPRCPVALDVCATQDQVLRVAGPGRRAACVRVGDGEGAGDGAAAVAREGAGRAAAEGVSETTGSGS
ncbi:oligopeptide/dipeptide ABC transporter ATP-binding protein, partial [Streptomyces sp. ZG43]